MLQGRASYLLSSYFILNCLLILVYPFLRYLTIVGRRSLKHEDAFGFTYENSIIYTVLAMGLVSYARSSSSAQFFMDFISVGKIGVACLLFMAKIDYCFYYILIVAVLWLVIPYPRYRAPNHFIPIKSVEQFDELINLPAPVVKKNTFEFLHYQYRNKRMYMIQFYADWVLPCTFTKQIWYGFSNRYETSQLQFLSVNVDKIPQLAARFRVNRTGFTKQLPTIIMVENGEQAIRFPPIDDNDKVPKVVKYDYKTLLRYFDLQSRYLETR